MHKLACTLLLGNVLFGCGAAQHSSSESKEWEALALDMIKASKAINGSRLPTVALETTMSKWPILNDHQFTEVWDTQVIKQNDTNFDLIVIMILYYTKCCAATGFYFTNEFLWDNVSQFIEPRSLSEKAWPWREAEGKLRMVDCDSAIVFKGEVSSSMVLLRMQRERAKGKSQTKPNGAIKADQSDLKVVRC